jgi:exonuclease VII small subunit
MVSVADAITAYERAARILDEEGKFYEKAKVLEEIGKIYEGDLVDLERAMNSYSEAAKMYNRAEKTA